MRPVNIRDIHFRHIPKQSKYDRTHPINTNRNKKSKYMNESLQQLQKKRRTEPTPQQLHTLKSPSLVRGVWPTARPSPSVISLTASLQVLGLAIHPFFVFFFFFAFFRWNLPLTRIPSEPHFYSARVWRTYSSRIARGDILDTSEEAWYLLIILETTDWLTRYWLNAYYTWMNAFSRRVKCRPVVCRQSHIVGDSRYGASE